MTPAAVAPGVSPASKVAADTAASTEEVEAYPAGSSPALGPSSQTTRR
jgi:hypothetical protein